MGIQEAIDKIDEIHAGLMLDDNEEIDEMGMTEFAQFEFIRATALLKQAYASLSLAQLQCAREHAGKSFGYCSPSD